jgi:site-specific recombinase XerD
MQGLSPQRVGKLTSTWMTQAGVKQGSRDGKSTHALRHSFAQMLYQQGGDHDLRLVQAALGHSCLSSTEVYMRSYVDTDRLRRALNNYSPLDYPAA